MLTNVIIHLINDLPILADLEALPAGTDLVVRCTNVRTVDGKRPPFVHDTHGTFVFPLGVIRLIEAPANGAASGAATSPGGSSQAVVEPAEKFDEEPDEDLLARIRSV